MKRIIAFVSLAAATIATVALFGQSGPAFSVSGGTQPVTQKVCNDIANLGSIYTPAADPAGGFSGTYVCQQIGSTSLRGGAWGWVPLQNAGSTSASGKLIVATGKTATINNSITLAGTDSTTYTFPATAITVPGTVVTNCGTANACSATTVSATSKVVVGVTAALDGASPSVAAVTGMPAFTSSSSYVCTANPIGSAASTVVVAVNRVSATAVTFTGPNGATATLAYTCIGS